MRTTFPIDGCKVSFTCQGALTYASGEFAGNVDLTIATDPRLDKAVVVRHLRLSLGDGSVETEVVGSAEGPDGVELTFYMPALLSMELLPASLRLRWVGAPSAVLGLVDLHRQD